MHSRNIISDLAHFVSQISMVKLRRQSPNRKSVEKTAKYGKKNFGTKTRPVFRHWCQESRILGCGMVVKKEDVPQGRAVLTLVASAPNGLE